KSAHARQDTAQTGKTGRTKKNDAKNDALVSDDKAIAVDRTLFVALPTPNELCKLLEETFPDDDSDSPLFRLTAMLQAAYFYSPADLDSLRYQRTTNGAMQLIDAKGEDV